jgi:TRAP-type C4-dicarboxylate transport system substrate-binding protein
MALAIAGSFAAGAPQLALAQVTAKFAVTLPEKSHQGQGVAKFIELVDAKSGGKIKIKGFYGGALGNDVQVTSALQGGTIEFTVPQTTTLTGMVKEYEILDFPFLFATEQQAEKVLDGPVGDKLMRYSRPDLVGLALGERLLRATNQHPIAGSRTSRPEVPLDQAKITETIRRSARPRCRSRCQSCTTRSRRAPSTAKARRPQ